MKIAFFSNYFNHHQVCIADEFYKLTDGDFFFIEINDSQRLVNSMNGYSLLERSYIVRPYLNKKQFDLAMDLARDADVAIFGGSEALKFSIERIRNGNKKVSFEYGERWLKKGILNFLSPNLIKHQYYYHTLFKKYPFYYLCASAYAADDLLLMNSFENKCFKWGYFTNVSNDHDVKFNVNKDKSVLKILYVSRFLSWKHPESMPILAKKLIDSGYYNFEIDMVGAGPKMDSVKRLIKDLNVENKVIIKGTYPNSELLDLMPNYDIFCFTSDRQEGWGAVLNEAMASGCCPVVSNNIGAAPYLINNEINGLIFDSCNWFSLFEKIKYLFDNQSLIERMSIQARETMINLWNPSLAASRFIQLAQSILDGNEVSFKNGPCSKA